MAKDMPAKNNIERRQTDFKGRRIHFLKAGQGPAVVLLHGGASNSSEWIRTMTVGGDRYTFYAPDLPGFGESDRDEHGYYLTDYTDFLIGFIDSLKLENPALAGHSFGARICIDTACRSKDNISKLVLIDASGLGNMSLFGTVLFNFFTTARKALRKPQPYPKFLSKEGVDWDYVGDEALKSIRAPTLLIWKSADPYLPLAIARRAARLIPGAELAVIGGYGHAPHQQNDNAPFNRLLLEFLGRDGQETLNR